MATDDRESRTMNLPPMYVPLFVAIWNGDRNAMETLVNRDGSLLKATVATMNDRPLNVLKLAIEAAQDELVEILVSRMPDEDSIFVEALPLAVGGGKIRIVETLLNKLPLSKSEIFNAVRIALSTLNAPRQKELIWFLAKYLVHHSPESPTEIEIEPIVTSVIEAGHSGMSKETIDRLVTMNHLFRSGAPLNFWGRCIYKCIPVCLIDITHDNPEDTKMTRGLLLNVDFARELIMAALTAWKVEIFRLVNTLRVKGQLANQSINFNILSSTIVERARGCPLYDAGAAFLLQRELQCFQIVEDMKAPLPSNDKTSFREGFLKERQDMLNKAGEWMTHTSSSCGVLAIFILTVAFAGAFTVPGGNDSSTGRPVFLKETLFIVFAIADALALFSSVSAALMFLGILTSRYAAYDFHSSLPRKLILGLAFLFASLACVLLAIGSAFTLVLRKQLEWIHIPIGLMGGFLLLLFTIQLLPLYVE